MMTEFLRQYLNEHEVAAEIVNMQLQPLPDHFLEPYPGTLPGQHRRLAANLALNLDLSGHPEVAYVLGFSGSLPYLPQTAVKINGIYYDPVATNIIRPQKHFIRMWDIPANELLEFVDEHNRPPTVCDWFHKARMDTEW